MSNHFVVDTRHRERRLTSVSLVLLAVACSRTDSARKSAESRWASRAPDVVATVGEGSISRDFLLRAAAGSGQPLEPTLERLVRLRLYGLHAKGGGLEQGRLRMAERATLARALLERIEAKTKLPSEPTEAEVAAMTERRWIEFDRPEAVITCHAIVHADRLPDAAGQALAQRLQDALRTATTCAEFLDRAKTLPIAGAKVTAERLPPVTPEGRTLVLDDNGKPVDEGPSFDVEFARAAHRIKAIGAQSGVVRTAFGWHVIMLESRLPALSTPLDERRRSLREDILQQRAKDETDRSLDQMRRNAGISVERAAIETIGRVRVDQ